MSIAKSTLDCSNFSEELKNYYKICQERRKSFFFEITRLERPISFSTIIWDKRANDPTLECSLATFQFFFPKAHSAAFFAKALKKAISQNKYYKITTEEFDQSVKNHSLLSNFSFSDFSKIPRLSSFAFLLTIEKISPIVIGLFKNGLVLLDGHHRSICSKITHSPIIALILDLENLKIPQNLLALI
jgi:hypothetical protein